MVRFWLGRKVIHFGIWLMPTGKVKDELIEILEMWAVRVEMLTRNSIR